MNNRNYTRTTYSKDALGPALVVEFFDAVGERKFTSEYPIVEGEGVTKESLIAELVAVREMLDWVRDGKLPKEAQG